MPTNRRTRGEVFDTNGLRIGTWVGPDRSITTQGGGALNWMRANNGQPDADYRQRLNQFRIQQRQEDERRGDDEEFGDEMGESPALESPAGPIQFQRPQFGPRRINPRAQRAFLDRAVQRALTAYKQSLLIPNNGKTFTPFQGNDVIENQQDIVTKGLWSGNVGNLLTFFTSSAETATQKKYYYEVFQSGSAEVGSEPQFAVAYGNRNGSGSATIGGGQNNDTPTRGIYSQYKLLLLERDDDKFTINGVDTDNIYVVNFNRARMREQLDPGNIEINLARLSGSAYKVAHPANNYTSSALIGVDGTGHFTRIIDDSSIVTAPGVGTSGKVYNLVSGSVDDGVYNPTSPTYYGLLYPQMGIAVLNGDTLDSNQGFATATASNTYGNNAFQLFTAISGAALFSQGGDSLGFQARSSENIKSQHYFVRVKNAEYNLSNNPSYITGSEGDFKQAGFLNNPKSYITTVGLYNDRRELLAVAKLSKPLLKDFTREALIKVKLDF